MARKKRDTGGGGGGSAPWMNTFADMMNLLLCFFVLLFSFSTVDAKKFEDLSISMANSIGILQGGEKAIGKEGQLINSGMSQLSEISEYFTTMGTNNRKQQDNIENEGEYSPKDPINTGGENNNSNDSQGTEGTKGEIGLEQAMEKIEKEMAETSTQMFDEVSDLADQSNLGEYVELDIDPEYQYVQLTLKGSVLYDSGNADIKKEAMPILKKIGDIIKNFEEHTIEITGHTDNVPMSSSTYKDNNWLSSARALNAAEYLIKECKISPAKLKYSGRGEYEPISSNATPEGRAKNRRIEIKIYNKLSSK